MFKFLFKKSFFDLWDNLLPSFLYNIVFMGIVALFLLTVKLTANIPVYLFFIICAVFLLILCFMIFGMTGVSVKWSNYDNGSYVYGFVESSIKKFLHVLLFFILVSFIIISWLIMIPFYMALHNYLGIILAVVLFWICLFFFMTLLFYPSLTVRENKGPFITLKMAMQYFADNKIFAFLSALYLIFIFLLSALSFFMIPGFMGLCLILCDSSKLIAIRYSYSNKNHLPRKEIDIRDMLLDEDSNLGQRTIRNTLFPWKNLK